MPVSEISLNASTYRLLMEPGHIEKYVTGQVLQDHSDRQRQSILIGYNTFTFNLKKWIRQQ